MLLPLFWSVTKSCPTLQTLDWAHQASLPFTIPELAQTHVHWVGDAIQPIHPPLPLSPPAFNLSQHQGLSQGVVPCIRWPKYWSFSFSSVLPMNIQGWFPLGLSGLISLPSKELSRVFSSTTVQKHQFFGAQPSLWSNSHIHTLLQEICVR